MNNCGDGRIIWLEAEILINQEWDGSSVLWSVTKSIETEES